MSGNVGPNGGRKREKENWVKADKFGVEFCPLFRGVALAGTSVRCSESTCVFLSHYTKTPRQLSGRIELDVSKGVNDDKLPTVTRNLSPLIRT